MNLLKKLFSKRTEEPADVPPEFLQQNPPDWLIDLKEKKQPHKDNCYCRVRLYQSSRDGFADILIMPDNSSGVPRVVNAYLTRPELDRLLVILGFSFPDEITNVLVGEDDDQWVTLSIYRQSPFTQRSAMCNLTGWLDSRKSGPPAIEIGRILLEARTRALSS